MHTPVDRHMYRYVYGHMIGHVYRHVCRHVYVHVCRHVYNQLGFFLVFGQPVVGLSPVRVDTSDVKLSVLSNVDGISNEG